MRFKSEELKLNEEMERGRYRRFAWLPRKLESGYIIWLTHYEYQLVGWYYSPFGGIIRQYEAREII